MPNSYRIKDWTRFQHYKRRNPPWIKVHRSLLDDMGWSQLDPMAAKVLVGLWLLAAESIDGELPGDIDQLAFRLRIPSAELATIIPKLDQWLEHDASSTLAAREQVATPETETETETETEGEAEAEGEGELEAETEKPPSAAATREDNNLDLSANQTQPSAEKKPNDYQEAVAAPEKPTADHANQWSNDERMAAINNWGANAERRRDK